MYFAIIGNHYEISLKELQLIHPKNLEKKSDHLITFDTNEPAQLSNIASLIKRGQIFPATELPNILRSSVVFPPEKGEGAPLSSGAEGGLSRRILWIADKTLGINLKKQYKMKRFKQVDILHTDMEVKNKGIELIKIGTNFWLVQGYQNIKLYEVVDFDKPARSMQTGMMPAKLTHSLINIAIAHNKKADLIFDPFCGTGTTGFIANYLGYNFIGSDIKLNLALTNQPRREHTPFFKDKLFSFFDQDISKPLNTTTFSPLLTHETLIVTEGRLGPVIKQTTTPTEIQEYQRRVKNLYLQFIQTITEFFPKDKKPVMVFTIPEYIGQENTIAEQITTLASELWRKMESLDEVYKRETQKVWRKIIILQ